MRNLAALVAIASLAAVGYKVAPTTVYSSKLPEGQERAIAERSCLLCHGPQLINQQHKDDAGWEKTIVQMEKWGAPVKPAEHAALKAYFVRKLGPKSSNGAAKGPPSRP